MPEFQIGNTSLEYTLRRVPHRKNILISLDWTTGITVVAPEDIEEAQIEFILRKKASWILRKSAELEQIKPLLIQHQFISGEKFPYLGRQYRLSVNSRDDVTTVSLTFQNGRFVATVPKASSPEEREPQLRQAFRQWYITHGLLKVRQRVDIFAPRLGVQTTKVVVKDQKTRWGSCSNRGTININWRVLMAPMRIVDYVVVHELAHLLRADHSPAFWSIVASIMPDYVERKEWLRVYGPTLEL